MSAELWGSRLKLKWVMNKAIFQGITAANAGKASRHKALERHLGKGPSTAWGLSFLLSHGEENTLLPAFILSLLLWTPSGSAGARKALLTNRPFLHPAVLMFLETGNFLSALPLITVRGSLQPGLESKRSAKLSRTPQRREWDLEKERSGTSPHRHQSFTQSFTSPGGKEPHRGPSSIP